MDKWHETILNTGSNQTAIFDVNSWLSKASLDAYVRGLRAFTCRFTDPELASVQVLLVTTLALWKTPATNWRRHTRI